MIASLPIDPSHAAFAGHFPGFPVLPGAALLDATLHEIVRSRNLDLTRWQVMSVKFLGIVRPGDVLTLEHSAAGTTMIRFAVRNPESLVASGTLTPIESAARNDHGI